MRHPHLARNAGFTLVEALVATVLMVFILGALATVTAQWLPNWNRGFTRAQRVQLLAVGMERLVADLSAAEIVSPGGAGTAPIFDGTQLSVTFVRTAIGPNSFTGLEVVRLAEITDARGPALVRTTAPFAPVTGDTFDRDRLSFSNPVVLIRAPYRISFSYAGAEGTWRNTWSGERQLPHAVRIGIRDAASSRTLAVSSSTVIHAELPAQWQKLRQGIR